MRLSGVEAFPAAITCARLSAGQVDGLDELVGFKAARAGRQEGGSRLTASAGPLTAAAAAAAAQQQPSLWQRLKKVLKGPAVAS